MPKIEKEASKPKKRTPREKSGDSEKRKVRAKRAPKATVSKNKDTGICLEEKSQLLFKDIEMKFCIICTTVPSIVKISSVLISAIVIPIHYVQNITLLQVMFIKVTESE